MIRGLVSIGLSNATLVHLYFLQNKICETGFRAPACVPKLTASALSLPSIVRTIGGGGGGRRARWHKDDARPCARLEASRVRHPLHAIRGMAFHSPARSAGQVQESRIASLRA